MGGRVQKGLCLLELVVALTLILLMTAWARITEVWLEFEGLCLLGHPC